MSTRRNSSIEISGSVRQLRSYRYHSDFVPPEFEAAEDVARITPEEAKTALEEYE